MFLAMAEGMKITVVVLSVVVGGPIALLLLVLVLCGILAWLDK